MDAASGCRRPTQERSASDPLEDRGGYGARPGGGGGPQRQLTGEKAQGTVKFFNAMKGFGFISRDDGQPDAFVHISAVERAGMISLNEGDRIEFELEVDRRGKTAAVNLVPIQYPPLVGAQEARPLVGVAGFFLSVAGRTSCGLAWITHDQRPQTDAKLRVGPENGGRERHRLRLPWLLGLVWLPGTQGSLPPNHGRARRDQIAPTAPRHGGSGPQVSGSLAEARGPGRSAALLIQD